MKKYIFLFLLLGISNPVFAQDVDINMDLPNDASIEHQLIEIMPMLEKAKQTNNLDLYYKTCTKGYNIKKVGDPKAIKQYNDFLSATAIEYSLQRYQLTKDKKYFKRAFKWSKIAVKDRTNQVYSIRADILLASLFLKPKEMQRAYDLYRAIDIEGAKDFQNEYLDSYNSTKEFIRDKSATRRAKWIYALKVTGLVLCGGLAAFGQSYRYYNTPKYRTQCYTIGNSVYCDTY